MFPSQLMHLLTKSDVGSQRYSGLQLYPDTSCTAEERNPRTDVLSAHRRNHSQALPPQL